MYSPWELYFNIDNRDIGNMHVMTLLTNSRWGDSLLVFNHNVTFKVHLVCKSQMTFLTFEVILFLIFFFNLSGYHIARYL
jgi:hypothetical protein